MITLNEYLVQKSDELNEDKNFYVTQFKSRGELHTVVFARPIAADRVIGGVEQMLLFWDKKEERYIRYDMGTYNGKPYLQKDSRMPLTKESVIDVLKYFGKNYKAEWLANPTKDQLINYSIYSNNFKKIIGREKFDYASSSKLKRS